MYVDVCGCMGMYGMDGMDEIKISCGLACGCGR